MLSVSRSALPPNADNHVTRRVLAAASIDVARITASGRTAVSFLHGVQSLAGLRCLTSGRPKEHVVDARDRASGSGADGTATTRRTGRRPDGDDATREDAGLDFR
jgi:hypothetical protein